MKSSTSVISRSSRSRFLSGRRAPPCCAYSSGRRMRQIKPSAYNGLSTQDVGCFGFTSLNPRYRGDFCTRPGTLPRWRARSLRGRYPRPHRLRPASASGVVPSGSASLSAEKMEGALFALSTRRCSSRAERVDSVACFRTLRLRTRVYERMAEYREETGAGVAQPSALPNGIVPGGRKGRTRPTESRTLVRPLLPGIFGSGVAGGTPGSPTWGRGRRHAAEEREEKAVDEPRKYVALRRMIDEIA